MKLTIAQREEFTYPRKDNAGLITGYSYHAFNEQGNVVRFTSPKKYDAFNAVAYDPAHNQDIELKVRFWNGTTKWQDAAVPFEK